jgi:FkbM family methyltransferase
VRITQSVSIKRAFIQTAKKVRDVSLSGREPFKTRLLLKREVARRPPNTPGEVRVLGWDIAYVDARSLAEMIEYQVFRKYNDFHSPNPAPIILDCGANIGISVLRFKQLYPRARITAFEPDSEICTVLRRNLDYNRVSDVQVVDAAVWREATRLTFHREKSQGGHLTFDKTGPHSVKTVRTVALRDYLGDCVDFLKLDIEGAEHQVLASCGDRLANVQQMVVEVHYHVDRPEVLAGIISILGRAGFKVALHQSLGQIDLRTAYRRPADLEYDQYPVLYAWR